MSYRRTLLFFDYCLTPTEFIRNAGILIEGETIIGIGGGSGFMLDSDIRICRYPGMYATAGFVDTHIHGGFGFDASCAVETGQNYARMTKGLAAHGVTSFVPTVVSSPVTQMTATLAALADHFESETEGAEPVGIHLEGPFIAMSRRSSQRPEDLSPVDLGLARELIAAARGKIRIWTFAPELKEVDKFIELLCEHRIIPSMGHTDADERDVLRAIDAGASRCTHIFNGIPPLDKRQASLATVALTDDRICAEIILDGTHLHPRMVELTFRCKRKDALVAISDAVQGTGLGDGNYHLGPSEIAIRDGISMTTAEGILAGATKTLDTGWKHLISDTGISRTDAAMCFTMNPAASIGLKDRGVLTPGLRADIAIFNAETDDCVASIIRGKMVHATEGVAHW